MENFKVYYLENLEDARSFLCSEEYKVVVSNRLGLSKCYGFLVLHYMFQTLLSEYHSKIDKIIVNVIGDYTAFVQALELGYSYVIHDF
ncbi:hypothetical protein [Rickettsia endosymbiont of Cardiosporidium cionae]|uniref:hypothetical protein n=1 Tax=Rickettsia endosymbiont of Cardiosporidium cionae TaxID=2777155 RepID=UPI0018953778|nr:hypothetical protein [Rickettsia endosymbiont of Cardiosporidium cionae]KAF8818363.1 hypothetical protein IHI24_000826 [Rickettsia endosymbiont of Cardiosporidium cionae]